MDKIKRRIRHTTSSFIQAAKELHNNKYDYSLVEFVGSHKKVKIGCPNHGIFEQRPVFHLDGDGCFKCARERAGRTASLTLDDFIRKAVDIHGFRYDYSKTLYTNYNGKVVIGCSKHGDFEQLAHNHLSGKGCSKCQTSKGETLIYTLLKKNNVQFQTQYRIPEVEEVFFYDFYLPDHKLLIEFHGIQHYEFNKHFHRTKEKFLRQIVADTKKRELANAWGYTFLCLKYDILDFMSTEEFETLLLKFVNRTPKRN